MRFIAFYLFLVKIIIMQIKLFTLDYTYYEDNYYFIDKIISFVCKFLIVYYFVYLSKKN
jgi:hypothetical protein